MKPYPKNEPTGLPYPEDCPLGGDTANDCADCIYSSEYHFDPESGLCIKRDPEAQNEI